MTTAHTDIAQSHLSIGDRVTVTGRPDHAFAGRFGTVIGFTKPHGFVRIHLDGDHETMRVLVHPESLKVAS